MRIKHQPRQPHNINIQMIETERLIIKPLNYGQLIKYMTEIVKEIIDWARSQPK
jgi:hypothetical protein